MAGHSKWANIQHRKGRQDAKRSNLWTKLVREIIVAARMGGGDPESNSRLRLALIKARGGNVPKDTISNAILKGTGQLEGVSYEEIRYEGYGIGGAALIIDCTTDNRVRTVADVRHALTKHGGNLGTEGSVSFMFKHIGEFVFAPGVTTEDAVMEIALEAGADDVLTDPDDGGRVTGVRTGRLRRRFQGLRSRRHRARRLRNHVQGPQRSQAHRRRCRKDAEADRRP